jgi:MFS family permease
MALPSNPSEPKAPFIELFRDGRAYATVLVLLSALMQALQVLVIAIVMPTVVADLGGTEYFTWPAMLYTIGGIVGAVCISPFWAVLGARTGYAISGLIFLGGTIACALAPNMAALVTARAVQGVAGGLIVAGGLTLVGVMFDGRLRTRVLALHQTTWTASHLLGPAVGGLFVELNWWRGSFWVMVPFILVFMVLTWLKLPERLTSTDRQRLSSVIAAGGLPFLRLGILTSGVFCLALAGPIKETIARVGLVVLALVLIWLALRIDGTARSRMFPSNVLNLRQPIGLSMWAQMLRGSTQNTFNLFLPLLLLVVHGVSPFFINFVTILISLGWTIGSLSVSGWSGDRERFVLWFGLVIAIVGACCISVTTQMPLLPVLAAGAFLMGLGTGIHNVHLIARTLAYAPPGEEKLTAAAIPSVHSLGTAFSAALAGLLAAIGGLTDVTDPAIVGPAINFVYAFNIIPMALAALLMARFARIAVPRETVRPRIAE